MRTNPADTTGYGDNLPSDHVPGIDVEATAAVVADRLRHPMWLDTDSVLFTRQDREAKQRTPHGEKG